MNKNSPTYGWMYVNYFLGGGYYKNILVIIGFTWNFLPIFDDFSVAVVVKVSEVVGPLLVFVLLFRLSVVEPIVVVVVAAK